MRRWPNAVSASARTRSSTMTCPRARSSHSTRSRPSRSRRIRSSSSACPRARRRRKTPRTTRRTRRRTTSPTMTRRTATRTRRTERRPRTVRRRLVLLEGGLLMCPSDSALTDAEPLGSSASLPAREVLRDLEGHFERLVVVESRVDEGLVTTPQTFVIDLRGPAHDLGDVVTGELDVQAAGDRARIAVGVEEALDLGHDVFEPARLVAGVRGDRVPMHGIADPGHVRQPVADAVEQLGQGLAD